MGAIYVIENRKNGKKYVGQTTMSKPEKRWANHISTARNPKKWYNKLYGDMNEIGEKYFSFTVIEEVLDMNLNDREKYWIKQYNSIEEGYNVQPGGAYKYKVDKRNKYQEYLHESYTM